MANQPYEDDLLMEAEGLDKLLSLYNAVQGMLADILLDYRDYLEPNLVFLLERNLLFTVTLINKSFVFTSEDGKHTLEIDGLLAQIEDVMDEIQVFQAGKPTKKGGDNNEEGSAGK